MQNNTLSCPGFSLSGTALKRIACLSMLLDHIGASLLENGLFRCSAIDPRLVGLDQLLRLAGRLENPSLKDIGYVLGVQPFDCTPFYNASLDFADKTVKNFNFLFSGAIFMLDSFVNENLFNQSI